MSAAFRVTPGAVAMTFETFFALPMPPLQAIEVAHVEIWVREGKVHLGVTPHEFANLAAMYADTPNFATRLVAKAGAA